MTSPQSSNQVEASSIAWTISRRLGMVVVLTLAFILSAVVTIYSFFRSGDTRVPDVVGKTEAEAQSMAQGARLNVRIQRRSDPTVPANSVIETRPGPNAAVKKESALTIVVSTGPQAKSRLDRHGPPRRDYLGYRDGKIAGYPSSRSSGGEDLPGLLSPARPL